MVTAKNKLLNAEDLLRLNSQGVRGELIRGVLCETMPAGKIHGRIAMTFGAALVAYVRPRRLGTVIGSDAGVILQRNPDTVREPDIAFISSERLPLEDQSDGYLEVIPELVVEIVSPSDSTQAVNDKTLMWLDHGVLMVLEVHPATRTVMVHRPNVSAMTLAGDDVLDCGDVLPGFALPLREIFDL